MVNNYSKAEVAQCWCFLMRCEPERVSGCEEMEALVTHNQELQSREPGGMGNQQDKALSRFQAPLHQEPMEISRHLEIKGETARKDDKLL